MNTDTLRLIFTYSIALVVVIGTFVLLVIPTQVNSDQLLPFLTAIIGVVIGFVFQRETATGQARATERAVQAGVDAAGSSPNAESAGV